MRVMSLPALPPQPNSIEECLILYRHRRKAGQGSFSALSTALIAYMAWPGDVALRDQWTATVEARQISFSKEQSAVSRTKADWLLHQVQDVAMSRMLTELKREYHAWPRVADVFQLLVDMTFDPHKFRGGVSIAKAVELLEEATNTPSHARFRSAWSAFRILRTS